MASQTFFCLSSYLMSLDFSLRKLFKFAYNHIFIFYPSLCLYVFCTRIFESHSIMECFEDNDENKHRNINQTYNDLYFSMKCSFIIRRLLELRLCVRQTFSVFLIKCEWPCLQNFTRAGNRPPRTLFSLSLIILKDITTKKNIRLATQLQSRFNA